MTVQIRRTRGNIGVQLRHKQKGKPSTMFIEEVQVEEVYTDSEYDYRKCLMTAEEYEAQLFLDSIEI